MQPESLDPMALSDAVLEPGGVALVGGGPGALDLITARGLALLAQADVVVVDRLGPAGLVERLGEGVEVIEVGKKPGHRSMRQEQINDVLVEQARAGRRVVRLKGGDPFLLGRGGEEVLACRAAGVSVQVVPGVSSSIAGPAAGDVPVTHRGTAVAVHVVNAHGDLGPADLAALADPGTTTVLLMGVTWLPRLRAQALLAGVSPATPVAVVARATMEGEQTVRGTLETIEAEVARAGLSYPAVIVVGRTAAQGFLDPAMHATLTGVRGSGRESVPDDVRGRHEEDAPAGSEPAGSSAGLPVLIGVAHGTRSRQGRDVVRRILSDVAAHLPSVAVRDAYVDVQNPSVAQAVAGHARPVDVRTRDEEEADAVVIPLLLGTGYHVRHDIGAAVRGRRAVATAPLGPDPRLATILAERLAQTEAGAEDPATAVVLAVSGTSDDRGQQMGHEMGELLAAELGRPVSVGFVSAASPSVGEAVAAAREAGASRVVVASYMLAPGFFHRSLTSASADVVSAPIGEHPLLTELIIDRYHGAAGA